MISVLVLKIITLFLIMMAGAALVKTKVIKRQDIEGLARITLYLIIPCVIFRAYDTKLNPTILHGMFFSIVIAIVLHLFFIVLVPLMRKIFHFNEIELLSVIYPNSANLSIPLIAATMGWNYVIYVSCFVLVQSFFIWSHGLILMQEGRIFDWEKMFLNINILASVVGCIMLLLQYHFPKPVQDAIFSIADMIGPVTMLICGVLLASTRLSAIATYHRWWQVILLRLVVLPLILVLLFKYSGLATLAKDGENILLVTLFGVVTPPATTLTLMAEVYHRDAVYANLLNVAATLLFLITLPLIMFFYIR